MGPYRLLLLLSSLTLASVPLCAEVKLSAADGFLVVDTVEVKKPPADVYRALGDIGRWWSSQHTWSHEARHLALELRAGGCLCEQWQGGSVEHGRVVFAKQDQLVRLAAPLGPLQELAVAAVLTFRLSPVAPDHTRLEVTYRVSGDSLHALDKMATGVDGVIVEQVARLVRFVETGKAD